MMPQTPAPFYSDGRVTLHHGDCLDVLATLPDASVDSIVTDPPYGLEFMGKDWDAPWQESDVNADAGFHGGGISATKSLPSFTGSSNPKCLNCKGTRRGRRDGTAKVAVCLCEDGGRFPNTRAVEMRAFGDWCELWAAECLRVLKPGGHLLAFGGTRTWHRLACAVEDAGFEVRDSLAWIYGSGFPKSLDVSKAIDKAAGAEREVVRVIPDRWTGKGTSLNFSTDRPREEVAVTGAPATAAAREWQGWGTALKPAFEPVVVARKPLVGTVAANVTTHGTGALNIDGCRIGLGEEAPPSGSGRSVLRTSMAGGVMHGNGAPIETPAGGRWPANVILDEDMAGVLDQATMGKVGSNSGNPAKSDGSKSGVGDVFPMGDRTHDGSTYDLRGDFGASRFFYVAKAPKRERPVVDGVAHPTVKPLALMRWLVRLVTPPGGVVLEPFAGSGTTVEACLIEGFHCIAIEKGDDYLPLILERIRRQGEPLPDAEELRRTVDPARAIAEQVAGQLDIFGEVTA